MQGRKWTTEEVNFLQDKWGVLSIKAIANNLNRSIHSVKNKAQKVGLDDARFNIDGITLNQLLLAIKVEYRKARRWIEKLNFPVKSKITAVENRFRYVRYEDFWKWAEQNKREIKWNKVEKNILGAESKWVDEWRKNDFIII